MSEFQPQHLYILLAHMLRTPAVAELACNALDSEHIRHESIGGSVFQGLLFHVIKKYKEEFGHTPDDTALSAEFDTLVCRYTAPVDGVVAYSSEIAQFLELKNKAVDERSEKLARKLIKRIAETCVLLPTYRETLSSALASGVISGLSDKLAQIEAKHASLSGGVAVTNLSALPYEELGERVVTGISWIDSRLGKGAGPVRGSSAAIIAPQACGKTTLGLSIAVMQALEGRHALLVLAEEGLTIPMRAKIYGAALGVPYEAIIRAKLDLKKVVEDCKIDPQVAIAKIARLDKFLHILDIAQNEGDLDAIDSELAHMRTSGTLPVYVYIDWAGILASRLEHKFSGNTTQALKFISFTVTHWAARDNSIVCVSQQMSAEAIKKGTFFNFDYTCAENCRGFTQPMKYAFIISPRDPASKMNVCTIAKARDDVPGERIVVKLEGEYPRFTDLTSKFDIHKRFFRPKNNNGRDVPSSGG